MEWLAFERFAATWKDYEAAYGYQEMFYWKMGRAGLCFVVTGMYTSVDKLCFNLRFVGVGARCYSLNTVSTINWRSCPSLGLSEGRGAEIVISTQACTASS